MTLFCIIMYFIMTLRLDGEGNLLVAHIFAESIGNESWNGRRRLHGRGITMYK
jgi:hypothetical protein